MGGHLEILDNLTIEVIYTSENDDEKIFVCNRKYSAIVNEDFIYTCPEVAIGLFAELKVILELYDSTWESIQSINGYPLRVLSHNLRKIYGDDVEIVLGILQKAEDKYRDKL